MNFCSCMHRSIVSSQIRSYFRQLQILDNIKNTFLFIFSFFYKFFDVKNINWNQRNQRNDKINKKQNHNILLYNFKLKLTYLFEFSSPMQSQIKSSRDHRCNTVASSLKKGRGVHDELCLLVTNKRVSCLGVKCRLEWFTPLTSSLVSVQFLHAKFFQLC